MQMLFVAVVPAAQQAGAAAAGGQVISVRTLAGRRSTGSCLRRAEKQRKASHTI
jgi:hypothetical protein